MGKLEHQSPETPLILLPFANGTGSTACQPALRVQGKMSIPIPICQKRYYFTAGNSRIPLCSLIWDQLFGRAQTTSCLWMCTAHSTHWFCTKCCGSLACTRQRQKFTTYHLSRQILQREWTSHVLVWVAGVHHFAVNLLKAQAMNALTEFMGQNSDLHSWKSEDTVYLTCPADFHRVYNPAVPDRCSGRFLDLLLIVLHI